MKSILISSIVAALMLFIQSTWLSRGIIMGIIPNLALDVLLFTSFINKEGQGIITSFLVGICYAHKLCDGERHFYRSFPSWGSSNNNYGHII